MAHCVAPHEQLVLGAGFVAVKTDVEKIFIPSGPSTLPRGTTAGPTLAAVKVN